jgi:hypothetical protein
LSIPEGIEVVNLKGKQFPLFGSVLLYAQQKCYLRSLEVNLIQAPTPENGMLAICEATATFAPPDGEVQVYTEIGDASPASVGNAMIPHLCRMSATRAKGRALRDGCSVTTALYEELSEGAGAAATDGEERAPQPAPRPVTRPTNGQNKSSGKFCQSDGCGVEVPATELKESYDSFKRILCKTHREELRRKLATRPAV